MVLKQEYLSSLTNSMVVRHAIRRGPICSRTDAEDNISPLSARLLGNLAFALNDPDFESYLVAAFAAPGPLH